MRKGNPFIVLTGGDSPQPPEGADPVKFRDRQYSLDEKRLRARSGVFAAPFSSAERLDVFQPFFDLPKDRRAGNGYGKEVLFGI